VDRYNLHVANLTNPAEIRRTLTELGVDPRGVEIMTPKGLFFLVRGEGLDQQALSILKQEMLAKGGEAAIPREVYGGGDGRAEFLLFGSLTQYERVCRTLEEQPFGLRVLSREIRTLLDGVHSSPPAIKIGSSEFRWGCRTYLMGIINATPDSFSGDGLQQAADPVEAAVTQAKAMADAGVDLLDIGAESTRPGAALVEAAEELRRLMPILRAVRQVVRVPISVDTSKAAVAEEALANGADCLNDVWGLQRDPDLAGVAAKARVPVVVMHNQIGTEYRDLIGDILGFLRRSIDLAAAAGIPTTEIIVDPGIGFGKTREQNLEVLRDLQELRCLGRPVLLGASRKSTIGLTLDLPVNERVFGTAATVALGIAKGADIIRVHDAKEMQQVARMSDAIVRGDRE